MFPLPSSMFILGRRYQSVKAAEFNTSTLVLCNSAGYDRHPLRTRNLELAKEILRERIMTAVTCVANGWLLRCRSAMSLSSLVVCPDGPSAQMLRRVLEELGIRVESCADTSRAAFRLAQERFDAVIVDCRLQKDVNALLHETRSSRLNDSTLAVVVVQGQQNVREMFSLGVNLVLYKPISYERAISSLRAARTLMRIERRRAPRASVHTQAMIDYAGGDREKATLVDLTEEGMAVNFGKRLPPTCKLYFQFALPGTAVNVRPD